MGQTCYRECECEARIQGWEPSSTTSEQRNLVKVVRHNNRDIENEPLVVLASRGDVVGVSKRLESISRRKAVKTRHYEHLACREPKPALHCAAAHGRSDIIRILVGSRCDATATDDVGNTPLHYAADLGHARAVHVLLEVGASYKSANDFGFTPQRSAQDMHFDSRKIRVGKAWIRQLFEGVNVSFDKLPSESEMKPWRLQQPFRGPDSGRIPLPLSKTETLTLDALIRVGDAAGVRACLSELKSFKEDDDDLVDLDTGKAPREDNRCPTSPLHHAAILGHVEVLRVLLATPADPNLEDEVGNTALHVAADVGATSIIQLLMKSTANPLLRNYFGHSAVDLTEIQVMDSPRTQKHKDNCRDELDKFLKLVIGDDVDSKKRSSGNMINNEVGDAHDIKSLMLADLSRNGTPL